MLGLCAPGLRASAASPGSRQRAPGSNPPECPQQGGHGLGATSSRPQQAFPREAPVSLRGEPAWTRLMVTEGSPQITHVRSREEPATSFGKAAAGRMAEAGGIAAPVRPSAHPFVPSPSLRRIPRPPLCWHCPRHTASRSPGNPTPPKDADPSLRTRIPGHREVKDLPRNSKCWAIMSPACPHRPLAAPLRMFTEHLRAGLEPAAASGKALPRGAPYPPVCLRLLRMFYQKDLRH